MVSYECYLGGGEHMLNEFTIDDKHHKYCSDENCRCGCHIQRLEKPMTQELIYNLGDLVSRRIDNSRIKIGIVTAIYCDVANYQDGIIFYPELYEVYFPEQDKYEKGFFSYGITLHKKGIFN